MVFNLPDDKSELQLTQKASDYYCALHDLDQLFRQWQKYQNVKSVKIEKLRDEFFNVLKQHDVKFDF
jgi:molybdopterin-guanine dinucleotide biosynthesis protein A